MYQDTAADCLCPGQVRTDHLITSQKLENHPDEKMAKTSHPNHDRQTPVRRSVQLWFHHLALTGCCGAQCKSSVVELFKLFKLTWKPYVENQDVQSGQVEPVEEEPGGNQLFLPQQLRETCSVAWQASSPTRRHPNLTTDFTVPLWFRLWQPNMKSDICVFLECAPHRNSTARPNHSVGGLTRRTLDLVHPSLLGKKPPINHFLSNCLSITFDFVSADYDAWCVGPKSVWSAYLLVGHPGVPTGSPGLCSPVQGPGKPLWSGWRARRRPDLLAGSPGSEGQTGSGTSPASSWPATRTTALGLHRHRSRRRRAVARPG